MVISLGRHLARVFIFLLVATVLAALSVLPARAAPYAAFVMDARTGEELYARNADTRLHPASLTKMLTLYIAFDAIERGEISLDTMVTVSKNAAAQPPSRLGLRAGQRIAMRHLIRAAAVKSANDAATAIGDALSGSEAAFAERMNRTARALGMRNSTFRNANGLTAPGHLSTARDMSILGRRLFYDFPQYYNIFSRRSADAGMAEVANTNRRFLDSYEGADGIKTGYTVAAGFNLTASAERGRKRIIATIFGGTSTAQRNAKMAELLDLGFGAAPANAPLRKPAPADLPAGPPPAPAGPDLVAEAVGASVAAAKTIRVAMGMRVSPRPQPRPAHADPAVEVAAAAAVGAIRDSIADAVAVAAGPADADAAGPEPQAGARAEAAGETAPAGPLPFAVVDSPAAGGDRGLPFAVVDGGEMPPDALAATMAALAPAPAPVLRPLPVAAGGPAASEVVTRLSTSDGGRNWGVSLGRLNSRGAAERLLTRTALSESVALGDGLRKIVSRGGGYEATFLGLTREQADLACRRLAARAQDCMTIGP